MTLSVPGNFEKDAKNNSENNSVRGRIDEILSKICFVYTVTFISKGILSSEITQIANNLMKKH